MQKYLEPLDMIKNNIHNELIIQLRNGTKLEAVLVGYDEHINLMLRDIKMYRKIKPVKTATNIEIINRGRTNEN